MPVAGPSESPHVLGKRKREYSTSEVDTPKFPKLQHHSSDPSKKTIRLERSNGMYVRMSTRALIDLTQIISGFTRTTPLV